MTEYVVSDPDYESRVRASYARQTVMMTIGAELKRVAPGEVDIVLPFQPTLTQQHGYLHAGIVATILDSACGYAAYSLMPAGTEVVSVEYKINLMAPAVGELFIARGRVIRPGRSLTVCTGEVYALKDGQEKAVAAMLATMKTMPLNPDRNS